MLFSFSKIDALLYYLLVTKSVSRDEVAGLFWPDKSEQNAKKNLRNAIYQANKMFGEEVISSPNKALLVLNDAIEVKSDIEVFMSNPVQHLDSYKEHFLKGFFLKECEGFEFWITKMRAFYEKIFLQECGKKIELDIEVGKFDDVEKNIQRLIHIDEFDESNYQLLMRFYQMKSRDEKVVEIYYQLSNLLKVELGITPNKMSKEIYDRSLKKLNDLQNKDKQRFNTIFCGRLTEIKKMETEISQFKNDQEFNSMIISGEAGIGKSALVNVVLDNVVNEFTLLEAQCYQVEKKYDLRPWKKILSQLTELIKEENEVEFSTWQQVMTLFFPSLEDHLSQDKQMGHLMDNTLNVLTEVLCEALNSLGQHQKILLLIEDIQWMDRHSFELLTNVMLNVSKNILFIFTSRVEHNEPLELFTSGMIQCDSLLDLRLKPFDFEETKEFIEKKIPTQEITSDTIQNVFHHTEGNLFFLMEYISLLQSNSNLNTMTVKMKDALKNRFLYLSEEEQGVANLVSYFYDFAFFEDLVLILGMDEIQLVTCIESLVGKNILKEIRVEGEVGVTFTHVKLREFVYMNQSIGKKRIYHNQIAECLENNLSEQNTDHLLYDNIAFHYKKARKPLKSLMYKLMYLERYLGFYHELYPVEVNPRSEGKGSLFFRPEHVLHDFDEISQSFESMEEKNNEEEYRELYCQYLYLKGRFFIKYGEYDAGVMNIEKVILQAKDLRNNHYLLLAYKQMIYYYIQIDEPEEMNTFIELALDLSIKENNHQSIGILLRLKGLYQMMCGNTESAEKLFKESISTFMLTDAIAKKYAVNIAAAYNYIGEIRFNSSSFEEAEEMFKQAIQLCSNKKSLSSLSVFYTNIGAALYAQAKYDEAEEYLLKSLAIYRELNTFWKRARLDAYLSLVYLEKNERDKVKYFLGKGQEFADKMKNERDLGIIAFSKAIIEQRILDENKTLEEEWREFFHVTPTSYAQEAQSYLNDYQDAYERLYLNQLFVGL